MNDFIMDGIGRMGGGSFQNILIKGVGTCSDSVQAESVRIEGVFKCTGALKTNSFYCKGTADFSSDIRANRMYVEGVVNVKYPGKIEAQEIICKGVIRQKGEISADLIDADGVIQAREIVGDRIIINSRGNWISRIFDKEFSNVELIEATTIDLSNVTARSVNGKDITIGPGCQIGTIDCSGSLYIDPSSFVSNITGNYTKRNSR